MLLTAAALLAVLVVVHPFLAVHAPVDADVLVVEGWVPHYVVAEAAAEYQRKPYCWVAVSGLGVDAARWDGAGVVRQLLDVGVEPAGIVAAPAAPATWNRTSQMARAVRDKLSALSIRPRGVNVVTLGPHARQSRLAYRRLFGPGVPVGVIPVPKDDYAPARWWASKAGIRKTTKDLAGYVKEVIFGARS